MKSKKYIKVIAVLLIVIAFIFISERFMKEEKTSFKVDAEQFEIAQSEEELNHRLINQVRYNKDLLYKVTRYGLMTEIENVEIPLIDEQRDFRIESIWNNRLELIITYSFNLLPSDRGPESIPYLRINRISLFPDEKEPITIGIQRHNQPGGRYWPNNGVVFENRLYRRALLVPSIDNKAYEKMSEWTGELDEAFSLFHQVDLKDVELVTNAEKGERTNALEDIPIDYRFLETDPVLDTVQLNQIAKLDAQSTITYTKLEKKLYGKRLYFSINSNHDISTIKYKVNGLRETSYIRKDANDESYIEVPTYSNQNKEELLVSVLSGYYANKDEVDFTIEQEDLEHIKNGQSVHSMNRDLGEINDVSFKLDDIRNVESSIEDMEVLFSFTVEAGDRYDGDLNFRNYPEVEQERDNYPQNYLDSQPFIEVKDQDNKAVKIDRLAPGGGGTQHIFGMTEEEFQQVEELNFRFFNIPQQVDFEENEVTLTIQ